MAGPITWKNVTGGGAGAGAALMRTATDSVTSGLSQIGDAIRGVEARRQGVYDREKEANTDAYLDQLASFETADDLRNNAANLEALRNAGPIDRDQIRGKRQSTLDSLIARDAKTLDRELKPLIDEIDQAKAEGNFDLAESILQDNEGSFLKGGIAGSTALGIRNDRRAQNRFVEDQMVKERQEAQRLADESFDREMGSILRTTSDPVEARALMMERMEQNGNWHLVQDRIGEIDSQIASQFKLSRADAANYEAYAGQVNAETDFKVETATTELRALQQDYRDMDAFDAANTEEASIGDVINFASERGWATKHGFIAGPDDLAPYVTRNVEDFTKTINAEIAKNTPKGRTPQRLSSGLIGAIAKEAVKRMGRPGEGIFQNNDLSDEGKVALKDHMLTIYREHLDRRNRKAALTEAEKDHAEFVATVREQARNDISDELSRITGNVYDRLTR